MQNFMQKELSNAVPFVNRGGEVNVAPMLTMRDECLNVASSIG